MLTATRTTTEYQPTLGPGEELAVEIRRGIVVPRKFGVIRGIDGGDDIRMHDRDVGTLHRSLVERVFGVVKDGKLTPTPQPAPGAVKRLTAFRTAVVRRMPRVAPGTRVDFVNTYRGSKRARVLRAAISLETEQIQRKDARLKTFVKAEKTNFTTKDDPAPRAIQPRDPRYNCEVGKYLKFVEHRIYSAVGQVFGSTTICKGLNPKQRGALLWRKWTKFSHPVAFGLDASRFDQHVSVEMLQWEHSVYNALFQSPELARLLTWQLLNEGTGYCRDGKIRYKKQGTRGSGDMNTALGNCLIMCALVWTFCKEQGIRAELANDGDDCVLIMEKRDADGIAAKVKSWFLGFGFSMKVDYQTEVFEEIEFCQSHPVLVDGVPLMVRNPRKAINCDLVSTKALDLLQAKQHLAAVGVCGGVISSGVPVLQRFYQVLRESGTGDGARTLTSDEYYGYGFTRMAMMTDPDLKVNINAITPETRVSYWRAFGIKPAEQEALEAGFSTIRLDSMDDNWRCRHSLLKYVLQR